MGSSSTGCRASRVLIARVQHDHGVAPELEHVASVREHRVDEPREHRVQDIVDVFGASPPERGEALGQRGEPRDVEERQRTVDLDPLPCRVSCGESGGGVHRDIGMQRLASLVDHVVSGHVVAPTSMAAADSGSSWSVDKDRSSANVILFASVTLPSDADPLVASDPQLESYVLRLLDECRNEVKMADSKANMLFAAVATVIAIVMNILLDDTSELRTSGDAVVVLSVIVLAMFTIALVFLALAVTPRIGRPESGQARYFEEHAQFTEPVTLLQALTRDAETARDASCPTVACNGPHRSPQVPACTTGHADDLSGDARSFRGCPGRRHAIATRDLADSPHEPS